MLRVSVLRVRGWQDWKGGWAEGGGRSGNLARGPRPPPGRFPPTPRAVPARGPDSSEPPLLRGTGQEGAALASLPELRFRSAPEDIVTVNYSQPLIVRRGSPLKCGAARVEARKGAPFRERAVYFRVNFE